MKNFRVVKTLSVIIELWGIYRGLGWFFSEVGALGPTSIIEPGD